MRSWVVCELLHREAYCDTIPFGAVVLDIPEDLLAGVVSPRHGSLAGNALHPERSGPGGNYGPLGDVAHLIDSIGFGHD